MEAYTGKLEMRDDLAPAVSVRHRGRNRSFLTHGKESWSRTAFVDGLFFHLLTFDEDGQQYILETLEPQGLSCRRVQAFATPDELRTLNGGDAPADNEAIVTLMEPQLAYVADVFADAHAEAQVRAAASAEEHALTEDEKTLYAGMMNAHKLSASQRKKIRDELIPHLKETGNFPG